MNRPPTGRHEPGDHLLREAFALRAGAAQADGLRDRILASVATTGQRRAWVVRVAGGGGSLAGDRPLLLVVAVALLAVAALAMALAGGALRNELPHRGIVSGAGGRIAYAVAADIYVGDADGSNVRLVSHLPGTGDCLHLRWADADTLLAATNDGLLAIDLGTGEHRPIPGDRWVDPGLLGPGPDPIGVSPDGRLVVTEAPAPDGVRMRAIDIASGRERWHEDGVGLPGVPLSWTPDGSRFLSETRDAVVWVDAATGRLAPAVGGLARGALIGHVPTLTPDGETIVYVTSTPGCIDGCGTLWSVPVAGGTPTRLTPIEGSEYLPRVSPDGKWVVYVVMSGTEQAPRFSLALIRPDGTGARPLGGTGETAGAILADLAWDADSGGLVVAMSTGPTSLNSLAIWHVSLADGTMQRLSDKDVAAFAREPTR
jgi:dipeptidyl aminopeptidase/acylaminoacyl peptidase